jgi:NAD(P)-dependent dehydrogenase (short-subunit alcohol dehydrogenase family)
MTTIGNASETRELAGKRALVTGGSRGIGAAVVRRLLDAGAEVLKTARSATRPAVVCRWGAMAGGIPETTHRVAPKRKA